MAKEQRATDRLNIELSRVSTVLSLMKQIVGELPESDQRKALNNLLSQADDAISNAWDLRNLIAMTASQI